MRSVYQWRLAAFFLFCAAAVSAAFPLRSRAEELFIPDCADVSLDGIPREWTEITDETRRMEILHQPVEALKSAPKAVSTFSAKITMEMKMVPNAEWMKEIAANYGDGLYHNDAVIEFAADYGQNKTYRKVKRLSLSRTVTGDSADTLTTVSTAYAEETYLSVETPREFSCRNYTEGLRVVGGPGVSDKIPGFPSVPLENLVTVDPPREAKRWGDSQQDLNLNQFYGSAKQLPVEWEDLVLHVGILDGSVKEQDEKIVRGLKEGLHVLETADEEGDRWFCWHHAFKGGAAIDYIWRESSGFLPVCHLNISKNKKRYIVKKVEWNHAGGAYVPAEIVECNYGETGEQTVNRRIRFTDTAVNQPIDPDRFSLKALELPEGGIIDDRVQKKVFEYKSGEPVLLAKYHSTKYMKKGDLETPGACRARPAEDGVNEQPAETNSPPAEGDVPQQAAGDAQKGKPLLLDDIRKLAEDGDEVAQLAWGEALLNTGTTQDEKAEGVEWIRKSAEHEDYTPAHYRLGMCYAEGNGVERDDAEAFKWFQKGAAEGQFVSLYQLALCHIDGRGTEQNRDAGIEILQTLAANGWEDAAQKLAELGVEPAEISFQERIVKLVPRVERYRQRAEAGEEAAQLTWGQTLLENAKTESEKAEGIEWIRRAAEQKGCSQAPYILGMCYAEGNGVEQSDTEAFEWFRKGAEACGRSDTQYQLALCYIEGRGTERNKEAGIEILRKLAENGFEDAKAKLAELGAE